MRHQQICVTSQLSVGCTFIDWSIHFLSGQEKCYHANSNQWINLINNPIDSSTAHGHKKNHPYGYKATSDIVNLFNQQSTGVFSMYTCPLHLATAADELGIILDPSNCNLESTNQIYNYVNSDYSKIFNLCSEQNIKLIYVDSNSDIAMYHLTPRTSGRRFLKNEISNSIEENANEFEQYFFANSLREWKNLNNIWDIRERKALHIRPFTREYYANLDFSLPHLWLDSRTVWGLGEDTMRKILDYVELPLHHNRLVDWLPIHKEWQKIQFKHLDFCYSLPHIVNAIINGWDYKFDNLTFNQEVVIQHCLIYQHGLNLKTWQLEKFPSNAQKLHQLLEPNIHSIDSIY